MITNDTIESLLKLFEESDNNKNNDVLDTLIELFPERQQEKARSYFQDMQENGVITDIDGEVLTIDAVYELIREHLEKLKQDILEAVKEGRISEADATYPSELSFEYIKDLIDNKVRIRTGRDGNSPLAETHKIGANRERALNSRLRDDSMMR